MATYGTIQDRINLDYLNRSDLTAETQRAIQASIRHYERQRWPWNEAQTTLTAVVAQSFLTPPTDFLQLDVLQVTLNSQDYALKERPFSIIREINTARGPNNLPRNFAIYQNRFELAPYPDSAYLFTCYYLKQLPALSLSTDSNDWISAAEDLIVYRASSIMWANVLRNNDEATYYKNEEREALSALLRYRDSRCMGAIKATKF